MNIKGQISAGYSFKSDREMFYNPEPGQLKPCIAFGGMGKGKTTCNQIPFGLRWKGSLIILEATGETSLVCLKHRQTFQKVSVINPFGAFRPYLKDIPEVRYNPMDGYWLAPGRTFGTRAQKLSAGCTEDQSTKDKYWDNSTRGWVKTIIMAESYIRTPGMANLGQVADIFYGDPVSYCESALTLIPPGKLRSRVQRFGDPEAEVKSIREVLENTRTQLDFLMEEPVAQSLSRPDIRIGDLRRIAQTLSIIVPMESMDVQDRYLTLFLECALAELQSEQFDGPVPVCIMIDELGQYPKMKSLQRAMSSLRKYNSFVSICINDYGTLKEIYGNGADTFINNAGLVQWMSAQDVPGSKYLSDLLGDTEVHTEGMSIGEGARGQTTINRQRGQHARKLRLPHEIRQNLGPRGQIVIMDGVSKPMYCYRKPYYETPLNELASPNPFYKGGDKQEIDSTDEYDEEEDV